MQELTLKCVAVIERIRGTSSTGAFKGVEVGDRIVFTCPLTRTGRRLDSGGYDNSKTKYIRVVNMRTSGWSSLTFDQLQRTLALFDFEQEG